MHCKEMKMSYPSAIRESLAKVEASRTRRLYETYPHVSSQERDILLRAFHPDYITDAFRELRLGPNKGDLTPRELADALEAPPLVTHTDILSVDPDTTCDVLVIGGGGAGANPPG